MGAGVLRADHGGALVKDLARTEGPFSVLAPEPVAVDRLADACEVSEGEVEALARLREHYAEGYRGVVLREVAGGFTLATDPMAERAARRLLAKPRTPPLTQAQAECLGIVAYLQPVSRPEIARIRGVASESAVGTPLERGLIDEAGASRFGAVLYRTTELFQKLFGLTGIDELPDPARFDPSPEDEGELRERLARAGDQRAQGTAGLSTAGPSRHPICDPRGGVPPRLDDVAVRVRLLGLVLSVHQGVARRGGHAGRHRVRPRWPSRRSCCCRSRCSKGRCARCVAGWDRWWCSPSSRWWARSC